MKIIWRYLKPHKQLILSAVLLAGVAQLLNLIDLIIFGKIIDEYAQAKITCRKAYGFNALRNTDGIKSGNSTICIIDLCLVYYRGTRLVIADDDGHQLIEKYLKPR